MGPFGHPQKLAHPEPRYSHGGRHGDSDMSYYGLESEHAAKLHPSSAKARVPRRHKPEAERLPQPVLLTTMLPGKTEWPHLKMFLQILRRSE